MGGDADDPDALDAPGPRRRRAGRGARGPAPGLCRWLPLCGYEETKPADCVYGDPEGKRTAFLFGDSHAAQWLPALDRYARQQGWRLEFHTKSSCSPVAARALGAPAAARATTSASSGATRSMKRIRQQHPEVVFVGSSRDYEIWNDGTVAQTREVYPLWREGLREALAGDRRARRARRPAGRDAVPELRPHRLPGRPGGRALRPADADRHRPGVRGHRGRCRRGRRGHPADDQRPALPGRHLPGGGRMARSSSATSTTSPPPTWRSWRSPSATCSRVGRRTRRQPDVGYRGAATSAPAHALRARLGARGCRARRPR